jgi:phage tail sheath protein FI
MPPTLTYPGVYIEELSSGVHTITGVATSIGAFVGWAAQGPTDKATLIQSWSDFESQYGGLDSRSLLGYSVNQFFNNGGQQTYIVRLAAADAAVGTVIVPVAGGGGTAFTVNAFDPGAWSSMYGVRIVQAADPTRFSLSVVYTPSATQEIVVESFQNLSMLANDPQSRSVESVINDPNRGSQLIQLSGVAAVPGIQPTPNPAPSTPGSPPTPYMMAGGADGTVLAPSTPGFHTALNADNTGTNGVYTLDTVPIFNLLCVPAENDATTIQYLQAFCRRKRAFYIVDCAMIDTFTSLQTGPAGIAGDDAINSAFYFPWVKAPDPLQQGRLQPFPPCGFVAGIYADTDTNRGVWKAPAGLDAGLTGEAGLTTQLTDLQNGTLNINAVNCLRNFHTYGDVVWGTRTLRGSDQAGSEWKYVPIRRLALFIESSLYDGTQWVVFEPNDEPLWSQIRMNVGAFMQGLFLQGAFQGSTRQQAYFVKCDHENNPQASINLGIVNILVGFAPLYPAEFVVIQIQQMAGQLQP